MSSIPSKKKVVIVSSGRGSGFEALIRAHREAQFDAEVLGLFCDQPSAPVIERAKRLGVKFTVLDSKAQHKRSRSEFDFEALQKIQTELGSPDVLILSGYFRILSKELIEKFRDSRGVSNITNIHPSLLPAFAGLHSYQQAFDYGCKLSGCTVHLVEEQVDAGPILAQESFSIEGFQDAELVEARGLTLEHALYSKTLHWFLKDDFKLVNQKGRLRVVSI